jgi:hypothetical protein
VNHPDKFHKRNEMSRRDRAGIGHLKRGHRRVRDHLNSILSTAGKKNQKLLRWAADFLQQIFYLLLIFQ